MSLLDGIISNLPEINGPEQKKLSFKQALLLKLLEPYNENQSQISVTKNKKSYVNSLFCSIPENIRENTIKYTIFRIIQTI